jgi:hypothetical protein
LAKRRRERPILAGAAMVTRIVRSLLVGGAGEGVRDREADEEDELVNNHHHIHTSN